MGITIGILILRPLKGGGFINKGSILRGFGSDLGRDPKPLNPREVLGTCGLGTQGRNIENFGLTSCGVGFRQLWGWGLGHCNNFQLNFLSANHRKLQTSNCQPQALNLKPSVLGFRLES